MRVIPYVNGTNCRWFALLASVLLAGCGRGGLHRHSGELTSGGTSGNADAGGGGALAGAGGNRGGDLSSSGYGGNGGTLTARAGGSSTSGAGQVGRAGAPAGTSWLADGGASSGGITDGGQGGADGQRGDTSCDQSRLWIALRDSTVGPLGYCYRSSMERDGGLTQPWGALVFDAEGRVTDNTALDGPAKEAWLDELADLRWLCLASMSFSYSCSSAA